MIPFNKLDKRLSLAAVTLLLVVVFLDVVTQRYLYDKHLSEQHEYVFLKLGALRHQIEKELTANLLLIQGTANFISVTDNLTDDLFRQFAQETLKGENLLRNIAAAPDFTMRFVYPLKGNEAVLGVHYKDLTAQWPLVQKAYESRSLVIAGPIKLLQGGTGLIGRAPVFIQNGNVSVFWGMISAVIDMDTLFASISAATQQNNMILAIRGKDGMGPEGAVFLGDEQLFSRKRQAVLMPVIFPSGSWVMAATPKEGWNETPPLSLTFHGLYLLMGLGLMFSAVMALRRNLLLQRTKELLSEAQRIAQLGNWKLDPKSGTFWWSDEVYAILGIQKKIIAPTVKDFINHVHPDDQEAVRNAYISFIASGESRGFDCRIIRPDGTVRHIHGTAGSRIVGDGDKRTAFGTIQDITDRKRMEEALLAEQNKLKAMADASYDAFIMIDSKDTILFWSTAAEHLFGWTTEEVLGKKMHQLIAPPHYHTQAVEGLRHFSRTGTGKVMGTLLEFQALRKDGSTFPVERSVSAFKIGNEYFAVGNLRDITDRKIAEEKLERMATTDSLTGLTNRARFLELAAKEIERCRRYGHHLSLIMLDADKFKSVNDTFGHDAGDAVLVNIGETSRNILRDADIIARIGGEEFVALMPETTPDTAMQVAERLRVAMENQKVITSENKVVRYTVSLGVTGLHADDTSIEPVLKRADTALYIAKHKGRNRVQLEL
ncbi:diguanylate cyclase [Desulfovibrio mangrovi]|uniref:diguanylate cyclase n=1 Tax=Desulfovibrio mangrovi TaxID=2976983 RepID=UPI002245873D|nr:diguanylate cyclase [Desulfovibrio mangrovi]UZP66200.1 diguanylate cyclase [Desulfovibrio mangrovi]